jgi:outer membrane protein OmpA-like peptidoglycan-associated protein/tetratricopeptide (TPR) repeat protein
VKYTCIIFILLISCAVSTYSYSQGLHSISAKAVKVYVDGKLSYENLDYKTAEQQLLEAIKYDDKFFEAYMLLGELYTNLNRFSEAAANYQSAVRIDSNAYRPVYFRLGNAEFMTGDYINALKHYKTYLRDKGNSEKNRLLSQKNIRNCEFAIEAMKKPVPFDLINAGNGINTSDDEYWPSITADGQTLMFTRQIPAVNTQIPVESTQEDFYISYKSNGIWQKALNAGEPLNTRSNEGAQSLSSNGKYMYFTACDRPGGLGSCDIYFSSFDNGKWSIPYNLKWPVNTSAWESTPSICADGNTLYFSSNRPGGFGGKDIWYSRMKPDGTWANPINMGKVINTEGNEMSPFIHFDGKTLYFASDGRPGMGGYDIYMSRMLDDSTWSEPKNLGYPINTCNDEWGLVIDATGKTAYLSSKRDNQNGKDIFYFTLDESIQPDPVSYLKGTVSDKETGKLLKADYELINLSTNKVTIRNTTDEAGNFLVCLPSGNNYGINVSKTGYLFYSDNFMFEGTHTVIEPLVKRIALSRMKVGEKMLLANVFYEVDSWELKSESMQELNNLADLLFSNKDISVEIGGYTDSTGSAEYNITLSEKRALSVVNYLISKGISSDRLRYKGYGNTSPIGDNITYEGRKLNRRTEVKIIANKK